MLSKTLRARAPFMRAAAARPFSTKQDWKQFSTANTEPVREEFKEMLKEFDYLVEGILPSMRQHYLDSGKPRSTPLNKFAFPPEIQSKIGQVTDQPASVDECLQTLKNTIEYSLKTMHPYFNDKLYAGSDPMGQVSEFVVSLLNTAVHVYHVAPVFSVMEVEAIKILGNEFGYDPATVDGALNPGGTMSNMMALFAARNEHFPHVRKEGWKAEDRPVAFTPIQSHYSINRGAMLSGMGLNQMIQVPVDRWTGAMIPEELDRAIEKEIAKGNKPFFVNSMAGSTVMGAYDDHNAIADICEKYKLWHHVDGCAGGFLVFSEEAKNTIFNGVHRSDSVAINPHKGMGVPQQCSMIMTNNKNDALRKANTSGAEYLFHDNEYAKYDIGDKTLACGRKPDGLKLWMCMQRRGLQDFRDNADSVLAKARHLTSLVNERSEAFEMVNKPMAFSVCFAYTPPAFRNGNYSHETRCKVHQVIFDRMQAKGSLLIQHNPLPDQGLANFFRVTLKGEKTTMDDMGYWLDEIERLGKDITEADL